MEREERVLRNKALSDIVDIAKSKGYKVFTFDSNSKYINQVFFEDKEGRIGSASEYYSGITLSTIHKPKHGSGNGTGFMVGEEFEDPENIDLCFIHMPHWAKGTVEKYKNWDEYVSTKINSVLTYYEI